MTEVAKKQRQKIFENEQQVNVVDNKMTLDEWYEKWITVCKTHYRDTTKHTYAIQYNRLREELGWQKLNSLNLVVLQDAFHKPKTMAGYRRIPMTWVVKKVLVIQKDRREHTLKTLCVSGIVLANQNEIGGYGRANSTSIPTPKTNRWV